MSSFSGYGEAEFSNVVSVRAPAPTSEFRGVKNFASFSDAINYIKGLPSAQLPSFTNRWLIKLYPGLYQERMWLPDYVTAIGQDCLSCVIVGDGTSGGFLVSVGLGDIVNCMLSPLLSSNSIDVGLFIRNSSSVFTPHESNFGAVSNGETLIFKAGIFGLETFTWSAGAMTPTAAQVVAWITATAVNVEAYDRFGYVELRGVSDALVTVEDTGTINAAIGFSTIQDTVSNDPIFEVRRSKNIIVVRGPTANIDTAGVLFGDRSSVVLNSLDGVIVTIISGGVGVELIDGGYLTLVDSSISSCNIGIKIDGHCVCEGGSDIGNVTYDVELAVGAKFSPRGLVYRPDKVHDLGGIIYAEVPAESIQFNDDDNLFSTAGNVEEAISDLTNARLLFLSPSALFAPVAGGATKGLIGNTEVWLFAGVGANKSVYGSLYIPDFDFGTGTVFKIRFNLAHTTPAVGSKSVQWNVDVGFVGGNDSIITPGTNQQFDIVQVISGASANVRTDDITATLTNVNIAKGDLILFELKRSPGDIDDDYVSKMALLGVELTFGAI